VFTEALDSARLECPLHRCGTSLSVICFRSACYAETGSSRVLACLFENLTRVFTRRLDEPGRSREAQELTWEIQGLSMHRFPLTIVQFNHPKRARSIALVLLCLHKRGVRFSLRVALSLNRRPDNSMTSSKTTQKQLVGQVLSDLLTPSTTTCI